MSYRYRAIETCDSCGEATERDGEHLATGNTDCERCPDCSEVIHLDSNGDGLYVWVHSDGAQFCVEDDGTVIDRTRSAVTA